MARDPLTAKQVKALSRALKRRGRALPKRGQCIAVTTWVGAYTHRAPSLDPRPVSARGPGGAVVEVCHVATGHGGGYFVQGGYDRLTREERRSDKRRGIKRTIPR